MIEPGQKPLLATLNALPQKSREKESTMTKPNTPRLALSSLEGCSEQYKGINK